MAGRGHALTDGPTPADAGAGTSASLGELAYHCAVAVLWVVLALVLLLDDRGVFTPDIKPEVYLAPLRTAQNLLPAWMDTQQLGLPNFNVGLAPVAVVVGGIQALGAGPALSVRLLHLVLLVVGGWGATALYREVAPRPDSRIGRLLAGLLFVANPYTVVAGDTLAVTLPLAFLPWQVLCLIRAVRGHGWRWPAMFALTFVPMSGMNAGVVPILQLAVVPAVLWYVVETGTRVRHVLGQLARCGLLSLLVSLYWLLPALSATGVGSNVLGNSETLTGIAGPSSPAEVLRGLGLWVMYGTGPAGPWQPGFTSYLTSVVVVLLSFLGPALLVLAALAVRGPVRRLVLGTVVVAGVVMVGLHPPEHPTPVGRVMRWGFDHVTALGALRTTNKSGSVLVLGLALGAGMLGAAVAARGLAVRVRTLVATALAVAVVGATWPAWSGGLFNDELTIPAYWQQAAAATDRGPDHQRVWLLPGQVQSHYRWSEDRVDDIDKSLLSRPPLVHTTIPNASPASSNLQAAIDTQLQEGSLPPGALSSAARYLGVGDLLVRSDVVWEETQGGRPALVAGQVEQDPGLTLLQAWGLPGENVTPAGAEPVPSEASLPPVRRFAVDAARPFARVEALRGSVLIDGDGWALAPTFAAGLLPDDPAFRYVGDLDRATFQQALELGTRVVLTDSNRRRSAATGQLTDSQGPLLAADEDPGPTRTLFGPQSQTVLEVEGGRVTASSQGGVFRSVSNSAPENAFDGDRRTGWVFGDFGRATGQEVHLRLDHPVPVTEVGLLLRPRGPVTISRVRLQVGTQTRQMTVPPSGQLRVRVPSTATRDIRLTVLRTRGTGVNAVGVDEVSVPGVRVRRVARLPERLTGLVAGLEGTARQAWSLTPVDVVLSRVRGTPTPADDEETGLDRDLSLPAARAYRPYGLVRPDSAAPDDVLDRLLGVSGDVVATSSSRYLDNPDVRASAVVDGNAYTGWSPDEPAVGSWLELAGDRRRVTEVDVQQPGDTVRRVQVWLDGRLAAEAALHQGTNRIPVPPQRAARLRLVVTARSGTAPVQVTEVGFGGARMTPDPAGGLSRCVTVAELDGHPLRMRPVAPLTGVGPALFAGCGDPVVLAAGHHELRAAATWMPDELVLRDFLGDHDPIPVEQPRTTRVQRLSASHWRITAQLPPGPQLLVLGQNWDARWTARLNGTSLGRPVVADGYSAAWVVDEAGRHTFDISFAPQRRATAGLVLSAAGVLLCVALSLRRRPEPEPVRAAQRRRTGADARRSRRLAGWAVAVALGWFLGGPLVGAVALVIAAWHAWRPPHPRSLILAALALVVATPVAFVLGNTSRWGEVTPQLVAANPWPGRTAACAVLLLCLGVWRDDRQPL